ncbi:hypothetical protein [Microbacterium resistens]|nr:hypothetical protein [Microbacterium resistens]
MTGRIGRTMAGRRSRTVLWSAFLAAHALVAVLGWILPSMPMGDVVLVYEPWSRSALTGGSIVGVTEPWVYPQLALLPMLAAQGIATLLAPVAGAASYLVAWAVLVTILDAVAFGVLLGTGRSTARRRAAWFWILAMTLLGPIAVYRIDAITVPVAVLAVLLLSARPAVASALLTIGAWIKIWPGAVFVAAVVLLRSRARMIASAAGVTALVVGTLVLLGGSPYLFGFLTEQTGRGLQIEAVAATPFLWLAVTGAARIEYSREILTFQIVAPGADAVSSVLTPLMAVVALAVAGLVVLRLRAGAGVRRLLGPAALALTVVLIVCNKVGSPQFQTWLIAPVVLWLLLDRRRALLPALLVLAASLLTQAVYPITYDGLLRAQPLPVLLLTVRNLVVVVAGVVSVRRLLAVPVPAAKPVPARSA